MSRAAFCLVVAWFYAAFPVASPGAQADDGWWSLKPLSRPDVPLGAANQARWRLRTPIDAFVLDTHVRQGLSPAPEADRPTLIRRLTYDLHGLPPSPDAIARFVADPAPDAYERLVDRLLASPRYAERWARHWLDVVHYGESHGYDKDKPRPNAWPYRDYVIRSLNADQSYWRFVEEQLAGDVLYPDDPVGIAALGFIAAGPWDFVGHVELREGTLDKEITRVNDRDDMLSTTISTFVSLTAHCARCHNHKFDPIPQRDYYALQAVFAGIDRSDRPFDPDPSVHSARRRLQAARAALAARQAEMASIIAKVTSPEIKQTDSELVAAEQELGRLPAATDAPVSPTNGYHSAIMPRADSETWVQVDLGKVMTIDEIRLIPARPTDYPDTPGFGFPLRFQVSISGDADFPPTGTQVLLDSSSEDFANPLDAPLVIQVAAPGDAPAPLAARYIRVTARRLWKRMDDFVFALGELQAVSAGANAALGAKVSASDSIEAGRWSTAYLVDGYDSRRLLLAESEARKLSERKQELETNRTRLTVLRDQLVDALLPAETRELRRALIAESAAVEDEWVRLPQPQLVFAGANGFAGQGSFQAAAEPRPIYLLKRGSVESRGDLMSPGALACVLGPDADFHLEHPNDEGSRRAALARWITDPRNGLARRSIVNRVWHYHFGRGIVDTPNDFGRMGSLPTHPDLLEWLSGWFERQDGSLKRLHRLIVTSSVYRQSSREDALGLQLDEGNRFLWRMNRTRLDAECIRDAMLSISGLLDETMGGPSQRQFLFKDDHSPVYDYGGFDVDSPQARRRSIYRFIVRSVPDPMMECLDCPDPSILTPKRNTTLTALQALTLLNHPFVVSQCRHFARRVERVSVDPAEQVRAACTLAWGRPPDSDETQLLVDFARRHNMAAACRLIFNSNEFLFVD